jgi:hypothetical protein
VEPGHILFKDYAVVGIGDISLVRSEVDALPTYDSPELFGFSTHSHVSASSEFSVSVIEMIAAAAGTAPVKAALGTATIVESVSRMCLDLLERLPQSFAGIDAQTVMVRDGGQISPMNAVLVQEVEALKRILSKVKSTLEAIRAAASGNALMSDADMRNIQALHASSVPPSWEDGTWRAGSGALTGWLSGLVQRCEQWRRWVDKGRPWFFWLAGFIFPRSFFVALKQEVCRRRRDWALDELELFTEV